MKAIGSIDVGQFRDLVVRPALAAINLAGDAAERLVLGTAAHESGFHYLAQLGGPALGFYQIEPATHRDLWRTFLHAQPSQLALSSAIGKLAAMKLSAPIEDAADQLVTNLVYATTICRTLYYRVPDPLPAADDLPGLAAYWKAHFNTPLGAGTTAEFIDDYRRLVAPVYL